MNLYKVDSASRRPRALAAARRLGLALLDSYAPQRCLYCDQPSFAPEPLCDVCLAEFRFNAGACPRCALPDCHGALCPACLVDDSPLHRVIAPLVYDPAVAYLVQRWKFARDRRLSEVAAKIMLNGLIFVDKDAILMPTPLHWSRRLRRGFNQSEDLLGALCRRAPRLRVQRSRSAELRRVRATAKQSLATTRADRRANLDGAFVLHGNVHGRSVVLLDDVCTTAATGRAMARVLLAAGASRVSLWCLARTPAHRR